MATSSSYNVAYNRNEVITEALELIGWLSSGEAPSPDDYASCGRTLNMMLKFWQAQGIAMWRNQELYIFQTPSAQTYSIGPSGLSHATASFEKTEVSAVASSGATTISVDSVTGISDGDNIGVELDSGTLHWTTVNGTPSGTSIILTSGVIDSVSVDAHVYSYTSGVQRPLFITEGRLHRDNGTEIPINMIARNDYLRLSLKTSTGKTSMMCYQAVLTDGVLSVWPTADSVKDYLVLTARMPVSDMDSGTDDFDFPQEWFLPIAYNLAVLIAPKYDEKLSGDFKMMAKMFFDEVEASSIDYGSLHIEVGR